MAVAEGIDLAEDRPFFLGTGLIYRAVCAPASWSGEQVSEFVSKQDPPGTTANRWVCTDTSDREADDDDPWKKGNPCQCADDPKRRHWLMNC